MTLAGLSDTREKSEIFPVLASPHLDTVVPEDDHKIIHHNTKVKVHNNTIPCREDFHRSIKRL